jgi:hypothetical protein
MDSKELSGMLEIVDRANRLLKAIPERGKLTAEHEDLLRAALVLVVAGFDAYLHQFVIRKVCEDNNQKHLSRKAFGLLYGATEGAPEDKAYRLITSLQDPREVQQKVAAAVRVKTFQKSEQLEYVFELVGFNRAAIWRHLDSAFTRVIKRSHTFKGRRYSTRKFLDEFIDRRDAIVHTADTWSDRRRVRQMKRTDAYAGIFFIEKLAREIDAFQAPS